jgi:DNA-binding CsgD family transcriptional regulator
MKRTLSEKQEKVLRLYLAGYTPREIGMIMNLHINTICSYKTIIMEKWEVENNVEMIIEAIRRGYIELEADQSE